MLIEIDHCLFLYCFLIHCRVSSLRNDWFLPNRLKKRNFLAKLVIFLRKMSKSVKKAQFSCEIGHLSEKDVEIGKQCYFRAKLVRN